MEPDTWLRSHGRGSAVSGTKLISNLAVAAVMTIIHASIRIAASAAFLLIALPASAQEGSDQDGDTIVTIGPGVAFVPKFPGSDKMELSPWPIIDVYRTGEERRYQSPDESFGFSLLKGDFQFGPSANFQSGRKESDVPGLGKVGSTIEVGGFVETYVGSNFRLRGEVRKGLGGHKGIVGDIGADAIFGTPGATLFSIGPRVKIVNDRYNRAFFGVNPAQSLATGFPFYEAKGGLHSAGALAFISHQFSPKWGIQGYSRYDRLLNDAADSPLVRSPFGSRNQYEVGLGLSYSFRVR